MDTHARLGRWVGRWVDGWMDGRTGGWVDGTSSLSNIQGVTSCSEISRLASSTGGLELLVRVRARAKARARARARARVEVEVARDHLESLLDVDGLLRRGLKVRDVALGLAPGERPLLRDHARVEVDLVAQHHKGEVVRVARPRLDEEFVPPPVGE